MSLADYLNDTAALLHDQNYLFTSQAQLTRWINSARRECSERTGCVRRVISGQSAFGASAQPGVAIPGAMQPGALPNAVPLASVTVSGTSQNPAMMTIPGVERYPYVGFFNSVLQAQHAGCSRVMDVMACSVNWGGTDRPSLDWMPWDELQAYARAYASLVTSYPMIWSTMSDGSYGEVWLWPVPSQAGEIELDAFCYPTDLATSDDFDAIPPGMQRAIKYGAAKLAYMSSNRWLQAQLMEQEFAQSMGVTAVAFDRGKTPSYYR